MIKIHIVDGAFDMSIDLQSPQEPASPPLPPASANPTVNLEKDAELNALLLQALGRIYLDAGRYHAAQAAFEQARDLRIQVFGDLHPLVAETQTSLASTLRRLGDLAGAHQEIKLAMATNAYYFGPESVPVALDLAERAAIFLQEGKIRDVQQWAGISTRILSNKNDPRRTFPMDLQARASQLCGKSDPQALPQALALYEQILAIDLQSPLGEQHPCYPTHLHNRATVLQSLGKLDTTRLDLAEKDYGKAIRLWTAMYGALHPDVVDGKSNLARVFRDKDDLVAAKTEFGEVLELDKKLRGENHPYVAYDLTSLGSLVLKEPKPDVTALQTARGQLEAAERIFRDNNLSTHGYLATTLKSLGEVLAMLKDSSAGDKLRESDAISDQIRAQCVACEEVSA